MIMREVSGESPLIVVCTAMCLGIVACLGNIPASVFCLFFLFLLYARGMLLHMVIGLVLAAGAISLSPRWTDIPDGEYRFQGTVVESGFLRGTYRIMLDNVCVGGNNIRGRVLFNVYDNVSDLPKGSIIEGTARVKKPRPQGNTGEFDYREYLLSKGITLSGYIKDQAQVNNLRAGRESSFRHGIISGFSQYARPESEVINAVLTGDCSGLVYSLRDSFASLGIAHLIAISGLHMGIMFIFGYGAVFAMLRILPPISGYLDTPFIAKAAGLVCVVCYTAFVGCSLPAVRSAIMVTCIIVSLMLKRKGTLLESLALAGIIILLWKPHSLYSSSFLLSFSSVLGIVGVYRRLQDSPRWVMYIAVPVVATAFTLPITMIHFGFVSLSGILANIIFVPWFSFVIMPFCIAGAALSWLSADISQFLLSLSFDAVGIIFKTGEIFGGLYPTACPGTVWGLMCYCGLIVAFFSSASQLRCVIVCVSAFLIAAIPLGVHIYQHYQPLCFDFISVGQGDSVLVTKGQRAVLIDAGGSHTGFDTGRFIVGPHLLRRGVTSLDLVVATHSHPDHIGGIPFVLERFPTSEIWTNMEYDWNPDFQNMIRIAHRKGIPVKNVCSGDMRHLGGMNIEVLNPRECISQRRKNMDLNLQSIVLMIGDSDMKGLFMGDVGGLGEIRLCRLHNDLSADVLKVGHHGSKNACQAMFLERVKPKVAVIPVGHGNVFHLPNRLCLDRLTQHDIATYRTDINGEVTISSRDNALLIQSGDKVRENLCR